MKRLVGENVTGLKQAVADVVAAIQRKANKDEVAALIASKCVTSNDNISYMPCTLIVSLTVL